MPSVIPGAPMWKPSFLFGEPLRVPTGFWFSYERHALLAYLDFLDAQGRGPEAVAVPDYMCHEVIESLRARGRKTVFYPLGPGFSLETRALAEALSGAGARRAAVLVCHFYGRGLRNLPELSAWCRERGAPLLEDCAHWPYPFAEGAFTADARFYTFRKLYGVPYGAAALLREDGEGFNRFLASGAGAADSGSAAVLGWALRELAKRAVVYAGIPVRREYRDLSQDPLKPFDRAHPWVQRLLTQDAWRECARRRRDNYRRYASGFGLFEGWARPLELDAERDVPYQLLLHLRSPAEVRPFIDFFLARGVSALRGLSLHEEATRRLDPDHPYRRQVSLPLHQDVGASDVERVLALAAQYRRFRGF